MNLRKLLRKLNNAVRPMHVEGQPTAVEQMYDTKNESFIAQLPGRGTTVSSGDERETDD